jgi:hypothetical protein
VAECRCQKNHNANGSLKGSIERVLDQKQARELYQTGIEASFSSILVYIGRALCLTPSGLTAKLARWPNLSAMRVGVPK